MPRGLLIFALCLPLAVLMGFMLADPLMSRNLMVIGGALAMLLIPMMITVHHTALIWTAGAYMNIFFLPGRPQMWMLMSALSFGISVLSRPLARNKIKPLWDRSVFLSLAVLLMVVAATAYHSGSFGLSSLGAKSFGGKKYIYIICAMLGFVALTLNRIPPKNVLRDVSIFCLGPVTAAVGNIAYMLGPYFYFLFLLFPVELVYSQAAADIDPNAVFMKRLGGFGPAAIGVMSFCFMRWGLTGILQIKKPYRIGIVLVSIALGLASGFRSSLAVVIVVGVVYFFVEKVYRTRYALFLGGLLGAFFVFLALFADRLPLAAQRAVSFLPVKVNAQAEMDAKGTIEWRLEMWGMLSREVPKYFWVGKGYEIDPTDVYLFTESNRRGFLTSYDIFVQTGDYHNGPLSLMIPFGIFGVLAFGWFIWASFRVLWKAFKFGDPAFHNVNQFLFCWFTGRFIYFLAFFGSFESDLWIFTSCVGLSLAVNGGVCRPYEAPRLKPIQRTAEERALITA
jgi:hypothetical protein